MKAIRVRLNNRTCDKYFMTKEKAYNTLRCSGKILDNFLEEVSCDDFIISDEGYKSYWLDFGEPSELEKAFGATNEPSEFEVTYINIAE